MTTLRECTECDREFRPRSGPQKTCSKRCGRKREKRVERWTRTLGRKIEDML